MPKSMGLLVAWAAVAALALWAGAARAQDYETEHPHLLDAQAPHPVLRLLHVTPGGCGCWASHNGYSCSSFRAETTFLFGSCRQFFGEPCLKGPPPPPWSPEARIPPAALGAYGAPDAGTGRGCHCGW